MFLNNRYHDPTTGQFISVDPLVTTTGEPYIYGAANPITLSDPDGLYPCPYSYIEELGCYRSPGGNSGAQNLAARQAAAPSGGPGFASGVWEGTKAMVTGPYQMAANPVDTARGLWDLAAGCGARTGCLEYQLFVAPSVNDYREHGLRYAAGKMVPGIAAALLTKSAGSRLTGRAAGTVDELAAATPRVNFGHGARHLEGTGLSATQVESTILQRVAAEASRASTTGSFWGRVQVHGTTIEYRAYTLPDGTINVGTYYVP